MLTSFAKLQFNELGEPVSPLFADVYFSKQQGIAESEYVFLTGNQLGSRFKALDATSQANFIIAETGFGTGLNFLLTMKLWAGEAPKSARLHYIACEKYPIQLEELKKIHTLWPELEIEIQALQAQYPKVLIPGTHRLNFNSLNISLTLLIADVKEAFVTLLPSLHPDLADEMLPFKTDAWFLDGFAPKCNPDMWDISFFSTMAKLSSQDTTVASFSCAGVVKNGLKQVGFDIKKKPGFGIKREMLTAKFGRQAKQTPPLKFSRSSCYQPLWHYTKSVKKGKEVIVIGAGLAGSMMAFTLAERGYHVVVLEKNRIASGASGNVQGVLDLRLSGFTNIRDQYLLHSFLYAGQFYTNQQLLRQTGSLRLIKEADIQEELVALMAHFPWLAQKIDSVQASQLAGIEVKSACYHLPLSGWLSPANLCQQLLNHRNIQVIENQHIEDFDYDKGVWQLGDHQADTLILAIGDKLNQFTETKHIEIKSLPGSVTHFLANEASAQLKLPLCGQGYVLPVLNNKHIVGATYEVGQAKDNNASASAVNLAKLKQFGPVFDFEPEITTVTSRKAVRAVTPDYMPVVGPVASPLALEKDYAVLRHHAKAFIPSLSKHYPGLYVIGGFGSHGLTYAPLACEYLLSLISGVPAPIGNQFAAYLSPARFLIRRIKRGSSSCWREWL